MSEEKSVISFEDLGLSEPLLKAIADCGYTTPTPIQTKAIPIILMSHDLIGQAQTGSGKTASFTLPVIDILKGKRARAMMPRSLILSPTRELAAQIAENFNTYGKYSNLNSALLVGGESIQEQKRILSKGVDVLIATPGRLLDLFGRGQLLLTDIKVLVIDEADRMLDMGFIPDIEEIISRLPRNRQTLLFSATMPDEIRKLADRFLTSPKMIKIEAAKQNKDIDENIVWLEAPDKQSALMELIDREEISNAFIFCNRKRDVDHLTRFLKQQNLAVQSMHGDMAQKIRTQALDSFKNGETVFLVCSDVAARGIDVDMVSHVFNFDIPFNAEDYVHRIGRTGRAGQKGRAFSLASYEDLKFVKSIEQDVDRHPKEYHLSDIETFERKEIDLWAQEDEDAQAVLSGNKKPSRNANKSSRGSSSRSSSNRGSSSERSSGRAGQSRGNNDKPSRDKDSYQKETGAQGRERQNDKKTSSRNQPSRNGSENARKNAPNKSDNKSKTIGFGDDIPAFLK